MGVIACILIALVHISVANGRPLKKPIALSVLSKDLQSLEVAFPTADLWPGRKIIKYDDDLQIVVNYGHPTLRNTGGQTFLMVSGIVTLAKIKKLPKGQYEIAERREIHKLLFHNSWVYFENPESDPVLNVDDYYIVDYLPLLGREVKEPTFQYVPGDELESELMDFIPRIRYERSLTGANVIKTSFRMKNGIKLDVQYDQQNDQATFSADYQVLVMTDERNVIKKSVNLDKLSFFLYKQSSPELAQLGLIYAIRVAPPSSKPTHVVGDLLRIKRDILLKDMLETKPVRKEGISDIVGMIKYDNLRIYTVNYIQNNQKDVLGLIGRFVANDGTPFQGLCVAFPEGQTDRNELKWFRNSKDFTENPVFFSCSLDNSGTAQIVLQEDSDYIALDVGQSGETDIVNKYTSVEPYLEYISYKKILQTMQIVTDAMKFRCAKGYPRRSFRLFVNIFLNFDCNTGIAYFDALDVWLRPGKGVSFLLENLPGVSYDSNTQRFRRESDILTDFEVRQLYPVVPEKVPQGMQYSVSKGVRNLAFELNSVEWDLKDTRINLLKNLLPQWGVVHVDNFVLFVAEKSKEDIDGEKVASIVVKCHVTRPESCSERKCAEMDEIVYDGNKIMIRNSGGISEKVPTKVYWPNTFKLPPLNDLFSVSYKIRYVKLPTFKKHMKDLAGKLGRHCATLKQKSVSDAKLSLHIQYFNNRESGIIGYYDCTLHYILFVSDFKIIKFPNIYGVSTAYRPGEESTIGLQNNAGSPLNLPPIPYYDDVNLNQNIDRTQPLFESEEDVLRRKYSAYILQDLIYDPVANDLHSKSMFMTEVYALRALPTNVRDTSQKGNPTTFKINGGPEVYVY